MLHPSEPQQLDSSVPEAEQVWFQLFKDGCRRRESMVRSLQVVAVSHHGDPFGAIELTTVSQQGAFEKWTKYNLKYEEGLDLDTFDVLELYELAREFDFFRLAITDGSRYLGVQPTTRTRDGKKLVEGSLSAHQLDTSFRSGALHCGLLFGEKWISEYASDYVFDGTSPFAEQASWFDQEAAWINLRASEESGKRNLYALVDSRGMIRRVEQRDDDSFRVRFTVEETVEVDGVELPSSGVLAYSYSEVEPLIVSLEYARDRRADESEEWDLVHLPSEFDPAVYTSSVLDMSSGAMFTLISKEDKQEEEASTRLPSSSAPPATDDVKSSTQRTGEGTPMETPKRLDYGLVGAVLAAFVALLLLQRLRR